MIYIIIVILLLFLSYQYDIKGKKRNRITWYVIVQIILILLAGLRYRIGFDTANYIDRFYNSYPSFEYFSFEDYPIGGDGPLYVLLNVFVISFGGKFYIVQLLQASFVISLIFHYFDKHTKYIFTCAFFYFLICFVQFNFEIMRGSMSIAVSLYANDYVVGKKWVKAYILYTVALLFHVQAFFLFVIPIFLFLRLNRKGVILLGFAYIGGIIIQKAFGHIIEMVMVADAINNKAAAYADNDIYNSAGGNLNYYIVHIFPELVYSLFSLWYIKKYNPSDKILDLEPFVIMGSGMLLLQMNLQILSRFVDYFEVYFILFMADCAVALCHQKKKSIRYYSINCLLLFLPLVFLTCYQHRKTFVRLIPYNSVLDRKIYKARENAVEESTVGPANINEY